jgi:hypothetical protein
MATTINIANHQAPSAPSKAPYLSITHENIAGAALAIWHQFAHLPPDQRPLEIIATIIDGMATTASVRTEMDRAASAAAQSQSNHIPVPLSPHPLYHPSHGQARPASNADPFAHRTPPFDVVEITMLAAAGVVVPNSDLHKNLHWGRCLPGMLAVLHEQYPDVDQSLILGDLPTLPPPPAAPSQHALDAYPYDMARRARLVHGKWLDDETIFSLYRPISAYDPNDPLNAVSTELGDPYADTLNAASLDPIDPIQKHSLPISAEPLTMARLSKAMRDVLGTFKGY